MNFVYCVILNVNVSIKSNHCEIKGFVFRVLFASWNRVTLAVKMR